MNLNGFKLGQSMNNSNNNCDRDAIEIYSNFREKLSCKTMIDIGFKHLFKRISFFFINHLSKLF